MIQPAGAGPRFFAAPDAYDRHMGRYSRELCEPFIALAELAAGARVLDVGCGTGVLTSALAQRVGPEFVTAVDPSEAFVAVCRGRVPGAQVFVADAESLPFADGRFDGVLSQLVVNFMHDPRAGVGEMRRVVRTDGVVAGSVWDYRGGMTLLRSFWDAAIDLALPGAREHDQGRTMPFCSPSELAGLWVDAGLLDVETGQLTVSVEYESFDDLWAPFAQGISPAGAYLTSLEREAVQALRRELFNRLGEPHQQLRLSAKAFWVRGHR